MSGVAATGVSRRRFIGLSAAVGAAAACSSCIRDDEAVAPPAHFDPMMRWAAFEGDVAAYPRYGYEATTTWQTLTRGTGGDSIVDQTSAHLTALASGVTTYHKGWVRAADDERVNGRPTFWTNTIIGEFDLPYRNLAWEYVDGGWARLEFFQHDRMPPLKTAHDVATTARFGRPERVKLPLRFTEPLPGMRIERVSIEPFEAAKRDVSVDLDLRGSDQDGVAQVQISVSKPYGDIPTPHHTVGYTTVDGLPAVHGFYGPNGYAEPVDEPVAYIERLTVHGVSGMTVGVSVTGLPPLRKRFAPDGAVGVLHKLVVVDDPAHWF